MQVSYVGPTVKCVSCGRNIPKKNTERVQVKQGKNSSKCRVCIMLDGEGEAA